MRVPVKPMPNAPFPENPMGREAERTETGRQGFDAVLDNLEFFLTRLRGLSCCRSVDLPEGGFCLFTGSDSASENWVFRRGAAPDEEAVHAALRFFGECATGEGAAPFIWPLPEGGGVLPRFGLPERGRLLAMSRGCVGPADAPADGGVPEASFVPVLDEAGAERWAETMWQGFGAEPGAPGNLHVLVRGMRADGTLTLVTARIEDQNAGTFLLASAPSSPAAGVYYFAVPPRYRRRGVATAMMAEILRIVRRGGKRQVLLQATPSGVPFYLAAEFGALGEIPLFSAGDDVF